MSDPIQPGYGRDGVQDPGVDGAVQSSSTQASGSGRVLEAPIYLRPWFVVLVIVVVAVVAAIVANPPDLSSLESPTPTAAASQAAPVETAAGNGSTAVADEVATAADEVASAASTAAAEASG